MEFYISRHAENERERRGIPREFLESVLHHSQQALKNWVSLGKLRLSSVAAPLRVPLHKQSPPTRTINSIKIKCIL